MTLAAIILVTLSAIIHATWNLIAKRAPKSAVFYALTILAGLVIYAPLCIPHIARNPSILHAWPVFAASGVFLCAYYVLMYLTYRRADLSLAYPLLRVSPIFSTIWAVVFLREGLTVIALGGIVATVLGCMILPQRSLRVSRETFKLRHFTRRVYAMALTASLMTSFYIVLDKYAMTRFNPGGSLRLAVDYVYLEMAVCWLGLAAFALLSKKLSTERGITRLARESAVPIVLIAPMLIGAYFLILMAMAQPGVQAAHVGAFRLVSVVFTVIAGIVLLKERFGQVRILAAIVIFAGLVMITLG